MVFQSDITNILKHHWIKVISSVLKLLALRRRLHFSIIIVVSILGILGLWVFWDEVYWAWVFWVRVFCPANNLTDTNLIWVAAWYELPLFSLILVVTSNELSPVINCQYSLENLFKINALNFLMQFSVAQFSVSASYCTENLYIFNESLTLKEAS